jgi:PAS domain S-box-containing protein
MFLYGESSVWESDGWHILSGSVLISLATVLILGIVWQRVKRRRAESDLAITYDRLNLAAGAGRSVEWALDVKSGRDLWFGDLQTIFGVASGTHSGRFEDFRRRIHPEDRELVSKAFADARQNRQPYLAEFRVVRDDGTVRWIAASGKFYYSNNGDPERMLGMALDITDRKMAEEALVTLSGRLIEAQERERLRIAREIHDDYQQRLAMLAIDLEELSENIGDSSVEARQRLHELWNCVSELGADLHSLSHRLHSSTLERLGLIAGVRAFCQEFADQQSIQVDFTHENVPGDIPEDVTLCLFRIVQEGLRNVKRHSGADRAEVRLAGWGSKLHLSVFDRGVGFDTNELSKLDGIGIRSMEERLRLLGGQLEIHSRPKEGTRIEVWLPFEVVKQRVG